MTNFASRTVIKLKPNAVVTEHYTTPKTVKLRTLSTVYSAVKDEENNCFRFDFNGIPYSVPVDDVEVVDEDKLLQELWDKNHAHKLTDLDWLKP